MLRWDFCSSYPWFSLSGYSSHPDNLLLVDQARKYRSWRDALCHLILSKNVNTIFSHISRFLSAYIDNFSENLWFVIRCHKIPFSQLLIESTIALFFQNKSLTLQKLVMNRSSMSVRGFWMRIKKTPKQHEHLLNEEVELKYKIKPDMHLYLSDWGF